MSASGVRSLASAVGTRCAKNRANASVAPAASKNPAARFSRVASIACVGRKPVSRSWSLVDQPGAETADGAATGTGRLQQVDAADEPLVQLGLRLSIRLAIDAGSSRRISGRSAPQATPVVAAKRDHAERRDARGRAERDDEIGEGQQQEQAEARPERDRQSPGGAAPADRPACAPQQSADRLQLVGIEATEVDEDDRRAMMGTPSDARRPLPTWP